MAVSCPRSNPQLCPTLCDPIGTSVHGISQARILEWVAIPFSRGTFLTQGWNTHLHWQVGSLWLSHQGSPQLLFTWLKELEMPIILKCKEQRIRSCGFRL